jgi:hypothetical protein
VLQKSLWLEALKYVALIYALNFVYFILQVTVNATCAKAAQAGTTHEDRMDKLTICRTGFAPYFVILRLALFGCTVYLAMCIGGSRRRQLRQRLGIPPTDPNGQCCHMSHDNSERCNDDCCLHYWCIPCALCQETRTVLQVQREQQQAAANTPAGYMLLQAPLVTDAAGMTRAGLPYTENREGNQSTFRLPSG